MKRSLYGAILPAMFVVAAISAGSVVLIYVYMADGRWRYPRALPIIIFLSAGPPAVLGAFWLARRLARSIDSVNQGLARLAIGRLDVPVEASDIREFSALAESLNRAARYVREKIESLAMERQRGEAILPCVGNGVIVINPDMTILKANGPARNLLDIRFARESGLMLDEVCDQVRFLRFVEDGLKTRTAAEKEITLDDPGRKIIRVTRSPLFGPDDEYHGMVIVLNDMTRIRRLERVRKNFADNVSHELKTPVTAIKGFVENLRSMEGGDRETEKRFLEIIYRQAGRLGRIVDGLLSLSRIEGETGSIPLRDHPVKEPLENAVDAVFTKANAKGVQFELICPENATAPMNPALMEQAIVNLLDNAVNYSEQGGVVNVTASISGEVLSIIVRDNGCGVAGNHLDRLFERFYRVDPARSRKLGGAGLGLSIVKHIAIAHMGRVSVESVVGEGSVFSIHIPAKNNGGV